MNHMQKGEKIFLGGGKKQRGGFILWLGLAARLLPVASTALSSLGRGKKRRGKKRRKIRRRLRYQNAYAW